MSKQDLKTILILEMALKACPTHNSADGQKSQRPANSSNALIRLLKQTRLECVAHNMSFIIEHAICFIVLSSFVIYLFSYCAVHCCVFCVFLCSVIASEYSMVCGLSDIPALGPGAICPDPVQSQTGLAPASVYIFCRWPLALLVFLCFFLMFFYVFLRFF